MQTTVKWFNIGKGYGFLENGTGPDIYINAKSLRGADKVATGDLVEFECHVFEGKLVARHVRPVSREVKRDDRRENHRRADRPEDNKREASPGNGRSYGNSDDDNHGNREQPVMQRPRFVMQ